jgi:hypothetical protein
MRLLTLARLNHSSAWLGQSHGVVYTEQSRGGVNRLVGLMQASRQVKILRENPSLGPRRLVSIGTDITHINIDFAYA